MLAKDIFNPRSASGANKAIALESLSRAVKTFGIDRGRVIIVHDPDHTKLRSHGKAGVRCVPLELAGALSLWPQFPELAHSVISTRRKFWSLL
jgi:hypothetical protein